MLASLPVSMLNQSRPDLGIPNRINLTSSRSSASLSGQDEDSAISTGLAHAIFFQDRFRNCTARNRRIVCPAGLSIHRHFPDDFRRGIVGRPAGPRVLDRSIRGGLDGPRAADTGGDTGCCLWRLLYALRLPDDRYPAKIRPA